jgi:hypothetical protein
VLDDFDPSRAAVALRSLGRDTPMIRTAARRIPSIGPWLDWLEQELTAWRPIAQRPRLKIADAGAVRA